jgi:hypothetical protein
MKSLMKRVIQVALLKKVYNFVSNRRAQRTAGALLCAGLLALPLAACETEREYETRSGEIEIDRPLDDTAQLERDRDLGASLHQPGQPMEPMQPGMHPEPGTTELDRSLQQPGMTEPGMELRDETGDLSLSNPQPEQDTSVNEGGVEQPSQR